MQPAIKTYDAPDGYRLHYRHWRPVGEARARVVYLHGIQSHGGWYELSCRRMCEAGYEVFFLDRRGSGLNPADRGHAASWRQLVEDVVGFVQGVRGAGGGLPCADPPLSPRVATRGLEGEGGTADVQASARVGTRGLEEEGDPAGRRPPSCPVVLLGVSWGGKLAAVVAKEAGMLLDGLGLLYPAIGSRIRPQWYEVGLLYLACAIGSGRKHVSTRLGDPALFTGSWRWQQFIAADPASLRTVSLSLLRASHALERQLRRAAAPIRVPTLMMLAGRDRIIDNAAARRFFEQLAAGEKRLIEYPEAEHTLEFEPDPEAFLRDLLDWLEAVVGRPMQARR